MQLKYRLVALYQVVPTSRYITEASISDLRRQSDTIGAR